MNFDEREMCVSVLLCVCTSSNVRENQFKSLVSKFVAFAFSCGAQCAIQPACPHRLMALRTRSGSARPARGAHPTTYPGVSPETLEINELPSRPTANRSITRRRTRSRRLPSGAGFVIRCRHESGGFQLLGCADVTVGSEASH